MTKSDLFRDAMGKIDDALLDDALSFEASKGERLKPLFIALLYTVLAALCIPAVLLISLRYATVPGLGAASGISGTETEETNRYIYSRPDKYYTPSVIEAYDIDVLKDLLPRYIPDNYVFYRLLTLNSDDEDNGASETDADPFLIMACVYLVDNRGGAIEEAVKNYGSSDFVNVDGGANAIEITVQKKIDASWVPHTSGVDYSSYIDFGDLSVQFIESRRVDVDVPQQPRTKGPMYDIDIDAGEYTLHYRYAAFGAEERLTATDLYKMITSCDYYKNF